MYNLDFFVYIQQLSFYHMKNTSSWVHIGLQIDNNNYYYLTNNIFEQLTPSTNKYLSKLEMKNTEI